MLDLLWLVVVAYLIGSVSGSLVLGRVLGGIDIRKLGSGNAGGTNAFRTVGWLFALGVVIIDLGKGAIAAGLLPLIPPVLSNTFLSPALVAASCGLAAVAGHCWPVFFGFRGGKGAGTAVGVIAVAAPWCILPLLLVWLATLIGTGYVGLATVLAGLSLVPAMWVLGPVPLPLSLGVLAILLAALLMWTHRSNLSRLFSGTESRFEKVRVLKRRR